MKRPGLDDTTGVSRFSPSKFYTYLVLLESKYDRLCHFVFAVRPHTIWRLTDFLLKAAVDEEMEYISVLTAREAVEIVAPDLIPANQSLSGGYGAVPVRVVPLFRERFAAPILDTLSVGSAISRRPGRYLEQFSPSIRRFH